jgi:phosphoglycerol geranylgeranyltransferase
MSILQKIYTNKNKQIAILLDPDDYDEKELEKAVLNINLSRADYIFFGGSLLSKDGFEEKISFVKKLAAKPLIIFPGSSQQVSKNADGILFLSLISGRNPEFLIGNHVIAATEIKKSGIEVLPTGYILIGGNKITTAHYVSNTFPIPYEKNEIAAVTAMTGEMLGLKLIYLDAGSGAEKALSKEMIKSVKSRLNIPLITGGGLRNVKDILEHFEAGSDMVVIGNAFKSNPEILDEISSHIHQ